MTTRDLLALSGGLLLCGSASTSALSATTPAIYPASSPWNLHYADDSCLLVRGFGTGQTKALLRFEKTAPSERFSLTLLGGPLRLNSGLTRRISLTFGPGGTPDTREGAPVGDMMIGEVKTPLVIVESASLYGQPPASVLEEVARSPAAEAKITQLLVALRGGSEFILKLGPMDKPMAALRTCTDNLVKGWGLDPDVQKSLRSSPVPLKSPGDWLRSGDYPAVMLSSGKSAVVRFRLIVDASGGVTGCSIPSSTKGEEFGKTTCNVLVKRARFTPAVDAGGKPVASYYVNSVTWLHGG